MKATEELYWASGVPEDIFPEGLHVFAADAGALGRLRLALATDFAQVELVTDAELESGAARPLRLPALRQFLDGHRADLMRHWDEPRIRRNTLVRARQRLAALQQLGAPHVVLANAQSVVDSVSGSDWAPTLELETLVPDACGAASLVDGQEPRYVEADVSLLVLLAALACVDPQTQSLSFVGEIAWQTLCEASDAVSQPAGVSVRPAVYQRVQRLEFTAVAEAVAPRGALLLVET